MPEADLARTPSGAVRSNAPSARRATARYLGSASRRDAARQRLDRGALGEAADPRRRAAAEREEVLPRREAAALGGQRDHAVQQRAELLGVAGRGRWGRRGRRLRARAPQGIGLAEVGQRLDLEPLAGIPLEDHRVALEGDARAAEPGPAGARLALGLRRRREAPCAPELRVATQLQEHGGHARGGEEAAAGERLDAADDRAQLVAALAPQSPRDAARAPVGGEVVVALLGRDRAGALDAPDRRGDAAPHGGRRERGARARPLAAGRRRGQRVGGQRGIVADDGAATPDHEHGLGRRRRGGGAHAEERKQDGPHQHERRVRASTAPARMSRVSAGRRGRARA